MSSLEPSPAASSSAATTSRSAAASAKIKQLIDALDPSNKDLDPIVLMQSWLKEYDQPEDEGDVDDQSKNGTHPESDAKSNANASSSSSPSSSSSLSSSSSSSRKTSSNNNKNQLNFSSSLVRKALRLLTLAEDFKGSPAAVQLREDASNILRMASQVEASPEAEVTCATTVFAATLCFST
jgi:hypothetical protein